MLCQELFHHPIVTSFNTQLVSKRFSSLREKFISILTTAFHDEAMLQTTINSEAHEA